ncbi:transposase [Streptomyces caeruleatus]
MLDDTGFVKKGTTSAGVQRQYSGTAGHTENCQIGVFAAYATTRGRALVDRELYLPKSWTDDRERCRAAKIPDERVFATKPELARTIVLRALTSPLPIDWVTPDAAYGQEWRFRRMLEETAVGYVLAVPKSQPVPRFGRIDHLSARRWLRHGSNARAATAPRARASITEPLQNGHRSGDAGSNGRHQHGGNLPARERRQHLPRHHPHEALLKKLTAITGDDATRWRGGPVRPPLTCHQPTTLPTMPLTRPDSETLLEY